MAKSTTKTRRTKPRPDFPLFPHASGRWAKKVRGRLRYFGKCADDPDGQRRAIDKWLEQKDALLAGREPRPEHTGLSIEDACNEFLHSKKQKVNSGELSFATWKGYELTAKQVLKVFGRTRVVEDLRVRTSTSCENTSPSPTVWWG